MLKDPLGYDIFDTIVNQLRSDTSTKYEEIIIAEFGRLDIESADVFKLMSDGDIRLNVVSYGNTECHEYYLHDKLVFDVVVGAPEMKSDGNSYKYIVEFGIRRFKGGLEKDD